MITVILSGYGPQSNQIQYVSVYNAMFETAGQMLFYGKNPDMVTDVKVDAGGFLSVVKYPHVAMDAITKFLSNVSYENALVALVEKLRDDEKNKPRQWFTIRFTATGPEPVTPEDFLFYTPNMEVQNELFIFESTTAGFPRIYLSEKSTRPNFQAEVFRVQAASSSIIADTATLPTILGKNLAYVLLSSEHRGTMIKELPDLKDVRFPTRGDFIVPATLHSEEMMKFCDKFATLLTTNASAEKDTVPSITPIAPKKDGKMTESESLRFYVNRQLNETGVVNLTDLFTLGVQTTLNLIQDPTKYIDVNLDLTGFAKKACIYEGMIHFIPWDSMVSPEEFFGVSDSLFVSHLSWADFPTRTNTK